MKRSKGLKPMTPEQYRAWQQRSKPLRSDPEKTREFQQRGRASSAKSLNRKRSGLGARRKSDAERKAHDHFREVVIGWGIEKGCWVGRHRPGHICHGPMDPHHLVKAEWIRATFGDLPELEFLRILYAPVIGCPACRQGHDEIERRSVVIYQDELTRECIEFCRRQGRGMYGRLLMACPVRPSGEERTEMNSDLLERGCPECSGDVLGQVCQDCGAMFADEEEAGGDV